MRQVFPLSLLVGAIVCSDVAFSQEPTQSAIPQSGSKQKTERNRKDASVRPLVHAKTLAKMVGQKHVRVIDVGPERKEYDAGHLPGAVFVHWIRDITDQKNTERYNLVESKTMEQLLRRLGIKNEDHIVLYDNLTSRLATRMFWSLKVYGHKRVSILDGGRKAWTAAGLKFSKDVSQVEPSQYRIAKPNKGLSVNLRFIEQHLKDKDVALVDGRPPAQYSGEEPGRVFHTGTAHKNRGHIPGALHIFWKDNFKPDGTFKSAKELKALYEKRGLTRNSKKTSVTYCNEGLHAAPAWFVLRELLGHKDVRVYDDSMSEWANSDQPMESGPSKAKETSAEDP
jgi:thiosulfate/3-mercaptopyruvate sulfurtransferase